MLLILMLQTLRVQTSASEQEEVQVEVTRLLVECYFDIVRKNLQDAVPKAIMHFLVLFVQRGLQQRLIRCLYRHAPPHLAMLLPDVFKQHSSADEPCIVRLPVCKMPQKICCQIGRAVLDSQAPQVASLARIFMFVNR